MKSSSFLIYTVCQIFLHWSKIFPDFFLSLLFGLSRGFRTCCRKQQNKIQPANKKASANFSDVKTRGAHFPAGGIFVSGLTGQQPRAQCFPTASTFLPVPTGQHLPFPFTSHSGQPVNRQMLFAASVFQTRKHEVHIFSASKTIASGLTGQYLPILFSYQPYNLQ